MSPVALAFIVLLVCLFLKMPVFASLLAGVASYMIINPDIKQMIIAQKFISGCESISLLAIPFFVCSGLLMNYSGITRRIMDLCEVITGHVPGGLAQVNVLLSTLMGGLSGSSLADAAMEAQMLVPEMERKGFSKPFASVVTAFSSLITPLIPPGLAMIVYGTIANVSIGKLFVSGLGIGILLCLSMMLLVAFISKKRGYGMNRTDKITGKEVWHAFRGAAFPLCLPILIIGSIRIGICTATEAGAVSVIYALLLGAVYKELTLSRIFSTLQETVISTAGVMLIVGAASCFSWVMTKEQLPQAMAALMVDIIHSKVVFLLLTNVLLLLAGMFLEGNAIMLVLVPLMIPIAKSYGINEINFAMMFIFNMAIGSITPPMGTCMFVTCGVTKCKTTDFIKESIPFFVMMLVLLGLITYVPFFSTFLVDLIY